MTNTTSGPPLAHTAPERPPVSPGRADTGRLVRRAGLVAGAGLMLMSVLGGFGNLVVVQGLVTRGDAARTAGDILGSEGMFRLGVASLYLVVVLDVVVAWALLRVLEPVSRDLARLAAWFRVAYAAVFMVAVSQLAGVPALLGGDGATGFSAEQRQAQALLKVEAFHDIWMAALILFGVHLVLIGYLAYASGYVPRVLGVLLVLAGLGYGFDSFVSVLSAGSPFTVSNVTFLGEFLLGVWLLVRGRRISLEADGHGI